MLTKLIERRTTEVIELSSGIAIEVHRASYSSPRGRTAVAVLHLAESLALHPGSPLSVRGELSSYLDPFSGESLVPIAGICCRRCA